MGEGAAMGSGTKSTGRVSVSLTPGQVRRLARLVKVQLSCLEAGSFDYWQSMQLLRQLYAAGGCCRGLEPPSTVGSGRPAG